MSAAWWIILPLVAQVSVHASEREPLPVLVLSPSSQATHLSRSTLLRLIGDQIEASTKYRVTSVEVEELAACRGRLVCLAQLSLREVPSARHLLVVSLLPRPDGEDLTSVLLLNLERARPLLQSPEAITGGTEREVRLAETAIEAPEERTPLRDDQEAGDFFRRVLERSFRPAFERAGTWKPYGRLRVTAEVAGLALLLDGRPVGSTVEGETLLVQVEVGPRTLEVRGEGYAPIRQDLVISSGETQAISLDLEPQGDFGSFRIGTTIAGGVVGAMGIGLMIHGLTAEPVGGRCVGTVDFCPERSEYLRFGYANSPEEFRDDGANNGRGPAIFPLGLGLFSMGLTMAAGTLLFGDDHDLPWPQILIGMGAGALVYSSLMLVE